MTLTKLMKSNHGTFGDQCPRKTKKIPPQTPRLVWMGKIATTYGIRMASSWLSMQSFLMW
jgi:hypothetical protein